MNLTKELSDIKEEMNRVDIYNKAERLTSFYELSLYLKACKTPGDVLQYLIAEIETKNRPSYVRRIYGYYHKILPIFHLEAIKRWRKA